MVEVNPPHAVVGLFEPDPLIDERIGDVKRPMLNNGSLLMYVGLARTAMRILWS